MVSIVSYCRPSLMIVGAFSVITNLRMDLFEALVRMCGQAENDWVSRVLEREDIPYIWTGGRKCNFRGCDREDLQPAIENGSYHHWSAL